MDKVLGLIGLAKKAGKLEVGEEPVGAAARARDARLILVAADTAENSVRRVRHFADAGQCLWVKIAAGKAELGSAVGRSACAMAAVTDVGFAEAIAKRLAEEDERFAVTAEKLSIKAQRAAERRKEAEQHEKNLRTGKKKVKKEAPAQKEEKSAVKAEKPISAAPAKKNTKAPSREERRRTARKRSAARRYEGSRPVKKGKGSSRKKEQA